MINIYPKICGIYIASHNLYTSGDTYNLVPREIRSNTRSKINDQQQEIFMMFTERMDEQFPFKRSSALLNRLFNPNMEYSSEFKIV